jgi:YbbR domain-containing protein
VILLRTTGLRLLLSIGLAFALWVFVSYTQNPDRNSSFEGVPVNIVGRSPELVIVDKDGMPRTSLATVNVTVQGPEETVSNVQKSALRAFVDLSGKGPGEYQIPVSVEPNRSDLRRLSFTADPDFLSFRLEEEITKTVPLTIEVTGSVPFSFEKGEARATVQGQPVHTARVRGPKNRIDLTTVVRATANIDRLTANYSSPRPLEALAGDGRVVDGVAIEPASVNVLVPISSSAGIKRVPVVPTLVGNPASGYVVSNVTVEPEFVQLTGGSGSLDGVQSIKTREVDLGGASQTISRTVALNVPANTSLGSGEPNMVIVRVQMEPIARSFQVTLPAPVQVADIGSGLLVTLSPQSVQLSLTGTAGELSNFDPATLQGTVSVRGLGAGTYTIATVFQLPRGVAIVGQPPKVTVTLRLPPTAVPSATPTETATPAPTAASTAAPTETAVPQATSIVTPTVTATPTQ